jgi:hypothetical protein
MLLSTLSYVKLRGAMFNAKYKILETRNSKDKDQHSRPITLIIFFWGWRILWDGVLKDVAFRSDDKY